jgi:hypothetical protein
MNISLNFKLILLFFLLGKFCFAQKETSFKTNKMNPVATMQLGYLSPTAYGHNFLNKALALKGGYMADFKLHLTQRFYIGLQKIYFETDVALPEFVGAYNSSKISHHYAQAGTSIFPVDSKFNILAGGGFGYAYYKNFQTNSKFSDDGFSMMGTATLQYRFHKCIGVFSTMQLARDFLSISAAPEQEDFLNNATFSTISFGVQVQIK